jgi:hypothetical protein
MAATTLTSELEAINLMLVAWRSRSFSVPTASGVMISDLGELSEPAGPRARRTRFLRPRLQRYEDTRLRPRRHRYEATNPRQGRIGPDDGSGCVDFKVPRRVKQPFPGIVYLLTRGLLWQRNRGAQGREPQVARVSAKAGARLKRKFCCLGHCRCDCSRVTRWAGPVSDFAAKDRPPSPGRLSQTSLAKNTRCSVPLKSETCH